MPDEQTQQRSRSRSRAAEEAQAGASDAPEEDAPPVAEDAYPKDTLIKRADSLLGVSPALAQGVLAEAEDEITIDAAKARIQSYLDAPVVNEEA